MTRSLVVLAALVVAAPGCIAWNWEGRPEQVPWTAANPVWSGYVAHGEEPAQVQAVHESRTCGAVAGEPATLHVWFEDAIAWSGVNAFFSGLTLLTVPTVRFHDLLVRGWVEERGERLLQAEARSTVAVLWWWPGVFVPHLWSDLDGDGLVAENLRGLTRTVIDDLASRFKRLPPRPAQKAEEPEAETSSEGSPPAAPDEAAPAEGPR